MTSHNEPTASAPRFNFFEKVIITTVDEAKFHLTGQVGTILGYTPTDDGKSWLYGVSLEIDKRTWSFFENELESTGEFSNQNKFYDGTSLRVRVDEKGCGTVIPKEYPIDGN